VGSSWHHQPETKPTAPSPPGWLYAIAGLVVGLAIGYSAAASGQPAICQHPMPPGGAGRIWIEQCA